MPGDAGRWNGRGPCVFFPWEDRYRLGFDAIDRQHRHLVELVNELYRAMYAGEGRTVLARTLDELMAYTATHFEDEERLMARFNYPDLEAHRQVHRKMAHHVAGLKARYDSGELSSPVQIGNFLKNWLTRHILGTDHKFKPFLTSDGRG
ncbi:MAG: bacteriohemerythrin [Desulfococcaceae bacterium]